MSEVTQHLRGSTGTQTRMGLPSPSQAPCHPAPATELLTETASVETPGSERLYLAEGIKENFLEGVGFQWDLE